MPTATEILQQQREALNTGLDEYFSSNPEYQQWWNTTTDQARQEWLADDLKRAAQDPETRAYALLKSSGFSNALDKFAEEHQLTDDEIDGVLQKFIDGTKTYQDGASAAARFKQEFKDSSLGIADVGSIGGALFDATKFKLPEKQQQTALWKSKLEKDQAKLEAAKASGASPARIAKLEKYVAYDQEQYDKQYAPLRESSIKYLETLATRQGEYAGLPGWKEHGLLAGLTALGGQIAGAAASPENLIPSPGGPVTGGILKRIGVYGARQAGENLALTAASEPIVQAKRQEEGMQEGFSVEGALTRSALAATLGGAMGTVRGALPSRAPVDDVGGSLLPNRKPTPDPLPTTDPLPGATGIDTERAPRPVVDEGSTPSASTKPESSSSSVSPEPAPESSSLSPSLSQDPTPRAEAPEPRPTPLAPDPSGSRQPHRRFSLRAAADDTKNAKSILADPNSRYTPMNLQENRQLLDELSDDELYGIVADPAVDNNLVSLAGLKLRERLLERGEDTTAITNLTASRNTTFAQNLRALRDLKSSPAVAVDLVQKELDGKGRDFTPDQRKELFQLAKDQEAAKAAAEKARKQAQQTFTPEAAKAVEAADARLAEAARKFDRYVGGLVPDSLWDILGKIMQGNLLTVRSLAQNVLGNAVLAPVRGTRNAIAATLDGLYGLATGKERTLYQPLQNLPEQLRGFQQGLKSASQALLKGQGDDAYLKGELQRGFTPLRSLTQALTGKDLAVDPKTGNVRMSDRAKRLLEGVLGGPPEIMFRFLRLGDDPFRMGAQRAELANQARLAGIKPGTLEWKQFMLVPPGKAQAAAEEVGKRATFQQDNAFSQWIQAGERKLAKMPVIGGPLKFLFKVVAPFLQFPVNYVQASLDYVVPHISLAKSLYHASQGNRRQALEALGASIVGGTMWTAADYLWEHGLLTPPMQWQDQKIKNLQYQMAQSGRPPGSLNVSGLKRLMSGQDPAPQPDDEYKSYEGLGIPGMIFWLKAENRFGQQLSQARGAPPTDQLESILKTLPGMANFMLDQTFVAGTNSMLEALKDWDRYGDRFMSNLFQAVSSIPAPNTLQSINHTRWDYIPELKGDTTWQTFQNIWNYKTLQLAKDHPVKIGLLGEPVRRTPEGSNPLVYNLLDPLKSQSAQDDPRAQIIWQAFRATGDTSVIPNPPLDRVSFGGQTWELDAAQHQRYQELVGGLRGNILENMARAPNGGKLPGPLAQRMLQNFWNLTSETAKFRFLLEHPPATLKPVDPAQAIQEEVDPYAP